jgi:predicted CXXCH cytochrome family protein
VALKSAQQQQADPLPLFDGRIRCLTCHQAHKDPQQNDLAERPMLLRGGPYPDTRQFCYRCHSREQYQQVDPHRMTGPSGEIREIDGRPICLFCHRERPEADADPDEVTFQADVAFLCGRCHAAMTGSFLNDHLHAKPKRATRREMRRTEQTRTIALPLARDGRITCSTCHNPHQEGVVMRTAARAGADRQKRLRLPKEELCGACHRP